MVTIAAVADILMQELPLSDAVRILLRLSQETGESMPDSDVEEIGLVAAYSASTDISDLVSYRPTEVSANG